MQIITDRVTFDGWERLADNARAEPFESVALRSFPFLVAAGYSSLFDLDVLTACCHWSKLNDFQTIAAMFLSPDPREYRHKASNYGAVIFSGNDDVLAVRDELFASREAEWPFSIFDISERMFVFPESKEWMLIGEREADLALFGFNSKADADSFSDLGGGIVTFASLKDGADYARLFMNYEVLPALLNSSGHA